MATFRNINYPRLTDEDEFESLVRDLMAREWEDPNTQKFGRSGQKQYGVDVYGRPIDVKGAYRAAQCKLRTTNKQLSKPEIEHEVKDARSCPYHLDMLHLVTDTPRDSHTQIIIDEINDREVENGGFRVSIWFWDEICERLATYPKLLVRYYPDHFRQLTTHSSAERLLDTPVQIVFLNLNGTSAGEALISALKMRGVRVHHDKPQTIDDVGIDGVVLYLDYNVERRLLTAQIARIMELLVGEDSGCPVYILLPEQLHPTFNETVDDLNITKKRFCFRSVNTEQTKIANDLFQAFFSYGYSRRGQTQTLNLAVRTRDGRPREVLLDMDWRKHLNINCFPSTDQWDQQFIPALKIVRQTLLEMADQTRIQFDCHLYIPAALALGYYFNVRIANIGVWARRSRISGLKNQFWYSKNNAAAIQFESELLIGQRGGDSVAVVELTTYVSIDMAVREFLRNDDLNPATHVRLPLYIKGESIKNIDESVALAYASQVGQLVRHLTEQGITDTHIFARIPSSLAVLIGQRLLACNRIHLYWYTNPGYQYAFSLQ